MYRFTLFSIKLYQDKLQSCYKFLLSTILFTCVQKLALIQCNQFDQKDYFHVNFNYDAIHYKVAANCVKND